MGACIRGGHRRQGYPADAPDRAGGIVSVGRARLGAGPAGDRPYVMRRKIRTPRRFLLRLTLIAACVVTVLFGLSTIFIFGAATHRRASLGWTSSSANAELVQVICHRGQFHLTIEFLVHPL